MDHTSGGISLTRQVATTVRLIRLRMGLVALICIIAAGGQSAASELGMEIRGVVTTAEGARCTQCEVSAWTANAPRVYRARADSTGAFALVGLPAGVYALGVAGPDGSLAVAFDGTEARYVLREGYNLTGLRLAAPPAAIPLDQLLAPEVPLPDPARALVSQRRPAHSQTAAAASAPRQVLSCGQDVPQPNPLLYRNRPALAFTRGDDRYADDQETISCRGGEAYGCTRTSSEVRKTDVAPSRPDCDDSGSINLPTLIIFSQMTVHKPTWPYYDRQPPTPAGCAKVLAPKCDDYHSFAGVSLHECQHRMGTEQTIAEAFQDLLQKIRAIQSTVRSQCYQCCLELSIFKT